MNFYRFTFGLQPHSPWREDPLSPTPVDLSVVCREVADDFKMSHPDRKITVESQGITGQWDEARLHQALTNLVKNAISHGGSVKIDSNAEDGTTITMHLPRETVAA